MSERRRVRRAGRASTIEQCVEAPRVVLSPGCEAAVEPLIPMGRWPLLTARQQQGRRGNGSVQVA